MLVSGSIHMKFPKQRYTNIAKKIRFFFLGLCYSSCKIKLHMFFFSSVFYNYGTHEN